MRKLIFFIFTIASLSLSRFLEGAQSIEIANRFHKEEEGPWLTGPLLTPSSSVLPVGHFNFEPYIFATKIGHVYDRHWHKRRIPTFVNVNLQLPLQVGFVKDWDFFINPTASWNHSQGSAQFVFNDLPLGLEYQLVRSHPNRWYPTIKVGLYETFPTGKYQHLDPKKHGTDLGGRGSYSTQALIALSKIFHLGRYHWFSSRLAFIYFYYVPVHVKGINAYGGVPETKGKVYPGNQFLALLGLEFSFNLNWAIALDVQYQHFNKTPFKGHKGEVSPGVKTKVGFPSSEQYCLAPALEYNWNANVGIIGGAWFTVAGRNVFDFLSWVIALNWYQ